MIKLVKKLINVCENEKFENLNKMARYILNEFENQSSKQFTEFKNVEN